MIAFLHDNRIAKRSSLFAVHLWLGKSENNCHPWYVTQRTEAQRYRGTLTKGQIISQLGIPNFTYGFVCHVWPKDLFTEMVEGSKSNAYPRNVSQFSNFWILYHNM